MKGRRVPPKFNAKHYTAYKFTSAYLETSDGKRIELNPKSISMSRSDEETRACERPVSLHLPSFFSISFTWQLPRQIRVGPFLMPFPPPDRMN
jgi:hypothetical protein